MAARPIIYPLTALRFFFALAVFGHHCFFLVREGDALAKDIYYGWLYEGFIGVSFFFVLSGFILAYNYQDRLLEGAVSKRKFYLARIARIYPLHLLTLLLVLPIKNGGVGALLSGDSLGTFVAHLTLTQSYWLTPEVYSAYNAPAWSISTELFFYLLFPFLAAGIGWLWTRYGRKALYAGSVVLIVPLLMLVVPEGWWHAVFYINPVVRTAEFLLGILLANAFASGWLVNLTRRGATWLELGVLGLLIAFVALAPNVPEVLRYSAYYWVPMVLMIGVFARQRGVLSRWLAHPAWQLLGEISFSLYMIHRPVMWYYRGLKAKFFAYEHVYADALIMLGLSLVCSYLLYRFFERPAGALVKRLGKLS